MAEVPNAIITDPRVAAALQKLGVDLLSLLAAAGEDTPAAAELGDGLAGIITGSIALGNCALDIGEAV